MNFGSIKMDSNLTGMWVNFFTAASIPADVAATYALTFTENRIQNDMLLDLNKEYLRDMGISRMGDVIAILRHAKQVHENTARERVLGTTNNISAVKVPVAAVTGRSTVIAQPSSPASRMLERLTRNLQVQEPSPTSTAQKRKLVESRSDDADAGLKKARLIRFAAAAKPQIKESAQIKQTVFSRLGNSEPVKAPPANVQVKTIYARLGSKAERAPKDDPLIPVPKDALKYEGILKTASVVKKIVTVTTSKNNVRKIALGCTMRADETPVSVKEKLALNKPKSVKFSNHVEYKEIEAIPKANVPLVNPVRKFSPVFNKPERRLSMPEGANGVKARLGSKNTNNLTITSNVFNRLGV